MKVINVYYATYETQRIRIYDTFRKLRVKTTERDDKLYQMWILR